MAKEPQAGNERDALGTLSEVMAGDLSAALTPKPAEESKKDAELPAEEEKPAEMVEPDEEVEEEEELDTEAPIDDTSKPDEKKVTQETKPADKPAQDAAATDEAAQRDTGKSSPTGLASAPSAGDGSLPDLDALLDAELEPLKEEWGEDFVKIQKNVLKKTIGPMLQIARTQLQLANAQAEEQRYRKEENLFLAAYSADPDANEPHIEAAVKLVKDGVIVAKEGVNPYKMAFAVVRAEAGETAKPKKGEVSKPDAKEKAIASTLSAGLGGKRKPTPVKPLESLEPDAIAEHLNDPMFAALRRGQ